MNRKRTARFRISVLFVLLGTLGTLSLSSCRKEVKQLGIHLSMEMKTLSNGLRVVMVENHTVPVVSYQTWYRVGSVDERPGITGVAHLFEHLLFKGTAHFGPREFFNRLEAKGAEVNAFTTRDYTVYYENITPGLLSSAIELEADRMQGVKLNDVIIDLEKQVVLEERKLRVDNSPAGQLQESLWQLAYRRHPYQWPTIGYPNDVITVGTDQILEFYRTYYQPSNAVVVIVGDFDPKQTFEWIEKYYGPIPKAPKPERKILEEPEQMEERRIVLYEGIASDRVSQAYHITSAEQEDSYALDVLANILFEGTSSRAHRRLVEEKNIAIGIDGSAFTPAYAGLFTISATLEASHSAEALELEMNQMIEEIQEKGVTEEEVNVAVKQLTVNLVDSVRTQFGLGQLIGTVVTLFEDPERFAEDLARYVRVKPADVSRVASKYLTPNNRTVVILRPESKRSKAKQSSRKKAAAQ